MFLDSGEFLEFLYIPDFDRVVMRAGEEGVFVGVDGDAFDRVRVGLLDEVEGVHLVLHDVLVDSDDGLFVLHIRLIMD